MPAQHDLIDIAEHCRVMSGQTIDLRAAQEFRNIAERLKRIAAELDPAGERARQLARNRTSAL